MIGWQQAHRPLAPCMKPREAVHETMNTGRPPKPTGQAINRNRPTYEVATLPAEGRKGPAPDSRASLDQARRSFAEPRGLPWTEVNPRRRPV
jgi:hypothetical protein